MVRFFIVNQQYTAQFSLIHKHDSYEPVLVMNRSKKTEELTGLNQSDAFVNEHLIHILNRKLSLSLLLVFSMRERERLSRHTLTIEIDSTGCPKRAAFAHTVPMGKWRKSNTSSPAALTMKKLERHFIPNLKHFALTSKC